MPDATVCACWRGRFGVWMCGFSGSIGFGVFVDDAIGVALVVACDVAIDDCSYPHYVSRVAWR
ncbi:hypothetical protein [Gordonia sp. (in: high G+C Gram-positive bacteria)]|uniref:hypothetical protein n=1 Tax=Gordonia sp. (in: high G+C Gram-positive bacteria) TaxID=84139 RepID=UPI003C74B6E0